MEIRVGADRKDEPEFAVEMKQVAFSYTPGGPVIRDFTLKVAPGETVAVMGRSGSGKSTLLHLIAGLLTPSQGSIWLQGTEMSALSREGRADLRLRECGFVLQFGELIPELTIGENIALPLQLNGVPSRSAHSETQKRARELGISGLLDRRVWEVSGGEMQRAAIARAVVHRPGVVLADEPTGALDDENADRVLDTLVALAREGIAIVVVTHDSGVAARCGRTVHLAPMPGERVAR